MSRKLRLTVFFRVRLAFSPVQIIAGTVAVVVVLYSGE
jgi:hypothetical protein